MRLLAIPISTISILLLSSIAQASEGLRPNIAATFQCNFGGTTESISVNVHPVNWEDDPKKPAKWGSISNIKVTKGSTTIDGTAIDEEQQRLAIITSEPRSAISAQKMALYEIDAATGHVRRSYFNLFSGSPAFMESAEVDCRISK